MAQNADDEWRRKYWPGRHTKHFGFLSNRRSRVVRRSVLWWERLGIFLSGIGVFLSSLALIVAVYQSNLMREQMFAPDRNSKFFNFYIAVDKFCHEIGELGGRGWTLDLIYPPYGNKKLRDDKFKSSDIEHRHIELMLLVDKKIRSEVALSIRGAMNSLRDYKVWAYESQIDDLNYMYNFFDYYGRNINSNSNQLYLTSVYNLTLSCATLNVDLVTWFRGQGELHFIEERSDRFKEWGGFPLDPHILQGLDNETLRDN